MKDRDTSNHALQLLTASTMFSTAARQQRKAVHCSEKARDMLSVTGFAI